MAVEDSDDAELGDAGHVVGVADREPGQQRKRLDQRAEPERAQQRARGEIAEHRAKPEPAEQRHQDSGRAQHDQRVTIGCHIDGRGHELLRQAACRR